MLSLLYIEPGHSQMLFDTSKQLLILIKDCSNGALVYKPPTTPQSQKLVT